MVVSGTGHVEYGRWSAVIAPPSGPSGPAASRPPRAVCVSGSEQTEETVELYREDV